MTTILNASNGATSGLIATGDNSGVLQLQTNNGTPALTLNATQALGVGSSPSYGTSGQVLTSGGTSASPTWTTPSSGAISLISTQTVSSATSIQWTGLSDYDSYFIILHNIYTSSNNYQLQLQVGYGTTPTYITSNYNTAKTQNQNGTLTGNSNVTTAQFIIAENGTYNSSSGNGTSGFLYLNGFISGVNTTFNGKVSYSYNSYGYPEMDDFGGWLTDTSVKTAIRIRQQFSNITGTASLYGISS